MAQPKKGRKASDVGVAKTYYLRFGVTRDVEREARFEGRSASSIVEELLIKGIEQRRAERAAA
jgi:hypothetical protein